MEQHSLSHFLAMALQPILGHNPEHINQMQQERQNRRFLPDIEFPESLHLELDLKTALEQSKDIFNCGAKPCFRRNSLKNSTALKT